MRSLADPLKEAQKLADQISKICDQIRAIDYTGHEVDAMTWVAIDKIEDHLCDVNFVFEEEDDDD